METDQLLRVPEFAGCLKLTTSCVRRWMREKKIVVVKLGRLTRIPASEVDRLIRLGTRSVKEGGAL